MSACDPQAFGVEGEQAKSHPSCSFPAFVSPGSGLCTSNTWPPMWSWQLPQQIPLGEKAAHFSWPAGRKAQPCGRTQLVQLQLGKLHWEFTTPLYSSGSINTFKRDSKDGVKHVPKWSALEGHARPPSTAINCLFWPPVPETPKHFP